MPKLKTHKGAAKRFRLTASGKIKRGHSHARHILTKKTNKRKRLLDIDALVATADQKRVEAEQRQVRSRERKAQQQIVHGLEKKIQALEQRQTELTHELESPETYEKGGRAVEINRELMGIQQSLAELTPRWEAEASKLAVLD